MAPPLSSVPCSGIAAATLSGVLLAVLIVVFNTDLFNEDCEHCLGEHNGMAQYCNQYL